MGSDQAEGILTVGGGSSSAHHNHSNHNNGGECPCSGIPGGCPKRRKQHQQTSFSCSVSSSNEVRFQSFVCDCHCITCSYRTPGTSSRSIEDTYRTPGNSSRSIEDNSLPAHMLAAMLTETEDEATDDAVVEESAGVVDDDDDNVTHLESSTSATTAAASCPFMANNAQQASSTASSVVGSLQQQPHTAPQAALSNASFPAAATEEEECVRVSAIGPCPRYGHSLTEFSPGHFLLFGGTDGSLAFNDLFVLIRGQRALSAATSPCACAPPRAPGRSSWTELRPLVAPPPPRFGHTCHLHHDKKQLIIFGGTDHQTWFNDMYALPLQDTGLSRTFEKIEPARDVSEDEVPCARRGHTLVPYKEGTCILFGGHSRVSLSDAWVLEKDLTWREMLTVGNNPACPFSGTPDSRYGHSAVIYREHMYVFGGFGASGLAEPHVWALNLETYVWDIVDVAVGVHPYQGPCSRFGHTASLVGCRMVIFGGMDGFPQGKSLNDAYQLNIVTLEWTKLLVAGGDDQVQGIEEGSVQSLLGPQARRSHAAALDSSGGRVIIFGGWGDCAVQHDSNCVEMEISPPTLREIARDWIGSKVVYPRPRSGSTKPSHDTCDT